MRSRVFISCGQASTEEVSIAERVAQRLKDRGFDPYVAKVVQNAFEINSSIVNELKNSDCYLFVNFRRERIDDGYRGSLFSNQEFAIAYAFGFNTMIVVNQEGVKQEGMLRYIGCNTNGFANYDDCLAAVERALDLSEWDPGFSRRLFAENVQFENYSYMHFTGERMVGRFLSLDIANRRSDMAALETSGRLVGFRRPGETDWRPRSLYHRSLLKASGRAAFSHTVFPRSSETFNLIFIGSLIGNTGSAEGAYLVSAIDLVPNPQRPLDPGEWELLYQFYAIGFPPLCVEVFLRYDTFADATARLLQQYATAAATLDATSHRADLEERG